MNFPIRHSAMPYRALLVPLLAFALPAGAFSAGIAPGQTQVWSSDSSWCWFQDDRAILDGSQLFFSGVNAAGAITVTQVDLETGETREFILNKNSFEADDHNAAALLKRPDGRLLAVYAGHHVEKKVRYRITREPLDISSWGPERMVETMGNATYANVYRLRQNGLIYNFYRGYEFDPNFIVSEDDGESWRYGGRLMQYPGRPYLRYASNGWNRIHFITTEEHPRDYNNSIYHGYFEYDYLFRSDGTLVQRLDPGASPPIPKQFTKIFAGHAKAVAWTSDIELDERGFPYIAFSVTRDPIERGNRDKTGQAGLDHRYHYARWDGQQWHTHEIAYAGSRLYPGEDEYTGNIALHPRNPGIVYISADVNPVTGEPLLVAGQRRYEIFRGESADGGANWRWTALTESSPADNIRPIVVADAGKAVVLWLQGRYTSYLDYDLKAMGQLRYE